MQYLIFFLIGINLITYILFGIDKAKATKKKWRIPEKYLFIFSFFGGSLGAVIGMNQFRHKTQKSEFKSVIYIIILVQISLISFLVWRFFYRNN